MYQRKKEQRATGGSRRDRGGANWPGQAMMSGSSWLSSLMIWSFSKICASSTVAAEAG